ncbi:hypothetical protein BBJ29_005095 [Phytophthora kernoviae]|uniref:Uncharacterized protein n=1 Tax=Phytophthora kernoviae TaxID=325452 RepID=A0A3F2RKZ8_9STRA|nr:hypothetical protein BBP00_00006453 [Phytophthora kernoviae]RLN71457.1 hypothetical protein BBJ29_005095 [Phytophthora kernoviae]
METAAVAASLEHRDALVVSALFLRTEFGGTSATYSLWLSQPCTSVVVVHLLLPTDAVSSVRLSSDRICFTPDNFSSPQLVEATPIECPLLTFGGLMTKRKAAAMGSQPATRLDLQAALPEETGNDAADAAPQDASWCVSHMACGYHFSVVALLHLSQ